MAHRTFKDGSGRAWEVWDVRPKMAERRTPTNDQPVVTERRRHSEPRAPLPPELRDGWLAFESGEERRRLTPPPEGWDALPDAELAALVERAAVSAKPRRLIE